MKQGSTRRVIMPDASTTVQIEDDKSRLILLELVRDREFNYFLPSNVTGWRPFGDFDGTDFEQPPPVCSWTGVTCDSNDGSITGLNLGDGFYFITLLGNVVTEDDDDDQSSTRRLVRSREYDIILNNKRRYSDNLSLSTTTIRRRDDETTQSIAIGPTIPYSLGKLHSLRFINLSSNQIHGTIPKSILQLPKLEIIDISNNVLTGIFPHFTSPAITVLDISKNQFHGSLPKHIFGHPVLDSSTTAPYLTTVVKFDISHNNFIGTIPLDGTSGAYDSSSGAKHHDKLLQNLKYFDLGYNMFSGTICNNIGTLASLEGLFLEHNRLVGTIPKSIFRESEPLPLIQLYLQQNSLSGTLSENIDRLSHLKELYVDGNKFTGSIPPTLCDSGFNAPFILNDTLVDNDCDAISCPVNSIGREGVAPCTSCPDDVGFHRYLGKHSELCQAGMSELQILDLFYESTHGDEWLDSSYQWKNITQVCQRRGVECNRRGQVTKIVLPSLGLRGIIPPEIGFIKKLEVLDLSNNQLKGFLPSDLRFAPLKLLDVRGSRLQGVVPPLLCIKEGVNGNGVGPPNTDINLLYACENIVCPRGTYSSMGRASLPNNVDDDGIQCLPCYDDYATLYMGRDICTDLFIFGMQLRRVDAVKRASSITLVFTVLCIMCIICMKRRRRNKFKKNAMSNDVIDLVFNENDDEDEYDRHRTSLPLQRWRREDELYDDDGDWTAADSDMDDTRHISKKFHDVM